MMDAGTLLFVLAGVLTAFWVWAYLVDFGGRLAHIALVIAAALVVVAVLGR